MKNQKNYIIPAKATIRYFKFKDGELAKKYNKRNKHEIVMTSADLLHQRHYPLKYVSHYYFKKSKNVFIEVRGDELKVMNVIQNDSVNTTDFDNHEIHYDKAA